ncbi:Dihydrolipoamide acetyltransferase component of pyruvate dehydrogenase complex OS=Streptomyces fumanus OX=67302 GN=GCM10018772_12080 PE=3 SV=1 [Streptomyces fumanus]
MAQVLEFKLPDLGEGLTEAEIVRWMVEVGDVVAVDQPVVEVETAKAMVEVPCPYGGVVTARFGEEGTELPVGAPLLTVAVGEPGSEGPAGGSAGTDARAAAGVDGSAGAGAAVTGAAPEGARADAAEGSGNVLVGYGTSRAPARRRRVRPGEPAPAGMPTPAPGSPVPAASAARVNGRSRDAGERDSAAAERGDGPVPVISPLVRRLARENGLDLRERPVPGGR